MMPSTSTFVVFNSRINTYCCNNNQRKRKPTTFSSLKISYFQCFLYLLIVVWMTLTAASIYSLQHHVILSPDYNSSLVLTKKNMNSNAKNHHNHNHNPNCITQSCIIFFFHIPKTGGTTIFQSFRHLGNLPESKFVSLSLACFKVEFVRQIVHVPLLFPRAIIAHPVTIVINIFFPCFVHF